MEEPQTAAQNDPLSVRLINPIAQAPQASVPAPEPAPRPQPQRKPAPKSMAAKNKASLPKRANSDHPQIQRELPSPSAPAMDMMDMINAARARRATEGNAQTAEESAANNIALANINRDMRRYSGKELGIGGVFRIISKGVRTAQFQFRGWNPGSGSSWRQTIEVDAGPNGDVELAIVQKMIALIRSHYSGDFNWDSHRLGRVIVLSARPSDNAELEDFLMHEFFGS